MCRIEAMICREGSQSLEVAKNIEPPGTGREESRVAPATWPTSKKGPELRLEKQAEDSSQGAIGEIKYLTLHQ